MTKSRKNKRGRKLAANDLANKIVKLRGKDIKIWFSSKHRHWSASVGRLLVMGDPSPTQALNNLLDEVKLDKRKQRNPRLRLKIGEGRKVIERAKKLLAQYGRKKK